MESQLPTAEDLGGAWLSPLAAERGASSANHPTRDPSLVTGIPLVSRGDDNDFPPLLREAAGSRREARSCGAKTHCHQMIKVQPIFNQNLSNFFETLHLSSLKNTDVVMIKPNNIHIVYGTYHLSRNPSPLLFGINV